MADFYRVANGNWNLANSWATTSGGTTYHAAPPTASDDVFFDAATPTGTHTVNVTATTLDFNCTGFTGTLAGGSILQVYGNFLLSSGMTYSRTGTTRMYGTGTHTFNPVGKTVNGSVVFGEAGSGTFNLVSDIVCGLITFAGGTLNLNDYNVTIGTLSSSGSATRTLNMGSGTMTINGSSGNSLSFNAATNLTFNADTSNIVISGGVTNGRGFQGYGMTFYNISIETTSGYEIIGGSNTFNTISVSAGRRLSFEAGTTQTVSNFTANGTSGNKIILNTPNRTGIEYVGGGDDVETNFTGTLSTTPIFIGTTFTDKLRFESFDSSFGLLEITDNGDGTLSGDGSGTINYTTGVFNITFSTPPTFWDIYAYYQAIPTSNSSISKASGTVEVEHCDISYSTATGGATWNAFTSNGNVDGGNNTGWIFEEPTNTGNFLAFM